jgi:hypothetical protein
MKKIALLSILLLSINLSAQQVIEKIFDFSREDFVRDMTKLEDGNLLILALKGQFPQRWQLYIILNENGDTLSVVSTDNHRAFGIVQIDSLYCETGFFESPTGSITMRDAEFNTVLHRAFGEMSVDAYYLGRPYKTLNNRIILEMSYSNIDFNVSYQYIIVFNPSDLSIVWSTPSIERVYSFIELADSTVICSGYNGSNGSKIELSRYDNVGNQLYATNFGDQAYDDNTQVQTIVYEDNVFLMCRQDIYNLEENNLQLYKVNTETGKPLWSKPFFQNYNAKITSSCNGFGNNMIVTGTCTKNSAPAAFIFTFNSNGDSISTIFIDNFYKLTPIKIISNNESIYLTGEIQYVNDSIDIYFLKAPLDTTYISSIITPVRNINNFNVYPNPAKDVLWITTNTTNANERYIVATSIYGTHNYAIYLNSSINNTQIDISNWSEGMYMFALYENGELIKTKKVVILK